MNIGMYWKVGPLGHTQAQNGVPWEYSIAESICTHYSNLSGRPDIFLGSWTFKKSGTLLFAKSRVQKNRVVVFQKEKRPVCLFSFWITMTLVFLHPVIFKKQGAWFFSGSQTDPGFQNKNSGCRLTGRIWCVPKNNEPHGLAIKFKRFKSNSKDSNSVQKIQIQFKIFKFNSKVSTYFSLVALSANVVVMQMHWLLGAS